MIKRTKTRAGTAKKTTFTLSAQAVKAVERITSEHAVSVRSLLDIIGKRLSESSSDSACSFLGLTLKMASDNADELDTKRSWSVLPETVEILKAESKGNNISRNLLLDSAIKLLFNNYTQQELRNDLKNLQRMLEDIVLGRLPQKYGVTLHTHLLPILEFDEVLFDQFQDAASALLERIDTECQRVFNEN